MSGSGGFSSGSGVTTPCENLRFKTSLASPKPGALSVNIGDILQIDLHGDSIVVLDHGVVIGGIACKESSRLRYCISQGNTYEASVLRKNGAQVLISVYRI